jgi:hypothetical protein
MPYLKNGIQHLVILVNVVLSGAYTIFFLAFKINKIKDLQDLFCILSTIEVLLHCELIDAVLFFLSVSLTNCISRFSQITTNACVLFNHANTKTTDPHSISTHM